jgi:omega-6 fatty acid desaturase (delta-12 desaturase)
MPTVTQELTPVEWKERLRPFEQVSDWRCLWQVVNSFVPFFLLLYVSWRCLQHSFWLSLPVSVFAAGFLVRLFIIQHDCGHGTFFRNAIVRDAIGFCCGCLTFTPYVSWARFHARHHAISSNLDRRDEIDDVPTLTVREYLALPWWRKVQYRLLRQRSLVLLVIPTLLFVLVHRFTVGNKQPSWAERLSVLSTNVAIGAVVVLCCVTIGLKSAVLVYAPTLFVASGIGLWIIYIEHQFEQTYWAPREEWDFVTASLRGSSFLDLPAVLRWFTGNIGYHHIHHIDPKIPNYNLKRCHESVAELQSPPRLTIREAWRSLSLALWDEDRQKLIGFSDLRTGGRSRGSLRGLT